MRILLADDDAGVVQALLPVLKGVPGAEVRVALNGQKALENAAALGGLDLLITDVVMTPMDGFTLRDELVSRYPNLRTILISGYDLTEYAEQTQYHQVLAKPIDSATLLAAIERELAPATDDGAEDQSGGAASREVLPTRPVAAPALPQASTPIPGVPSISQPTAGGQAEELPATGDETATSGETATSDEPPEAEDDVLVGQNVGAYQVLRRAAATAWGHEYVAVQTSINRTVGLQVLDPARAEDENVKARFIADARAKANVQHPSILSVYEAGEAAGHIFYTHEFVDGQTLAEIRASGAKLDEASALKILRVVGEGLAYLSARSVPHTPLEPGSVYLGADGLPRLTNIATQHADQDFSTEEQIAALGRMLISVLPPLQQANPGIRALVGRMVQTGPQAISSWGALLQGVKALEPKVIPIEAAKISAQDRAAIAAVEDARKRQKRSLITNVAVMVSFVFFAVFMIFKFLVSNERSLEGTEKIPAGEFLFGSGQKLTLEEFDIDRYEVTYGQYGKFVEFLEGHPTTEYDHPQQPRVKAQEMHKPRDWKVFYGRAKFAKPVHSTPIDLNCPVGEVDWWDAYAYAKWKGRALPTEHQWEKAGRGTTGLIYPWGDELDRSKVNSNADFNAKDPAAKGHVDGYNFWNPVDRIKGDKSPFNVIGMAGNVSEWIGDWDAARKHPILKGGSYLTPDVRLDQRVADLKFEAISEAIGFRTVNRAISAK